ncbi:hypothetical protein D1R32_gp416 [Tunisvirus fontaine2]|uniref:Uncharacterized protein n=1 Tax=Tunisvirus fontaine2 TaxID=1421067 RepID=V9SE06_9VIRU|nr:hypothetical protein D1R32_gp416 [Tunisvirus fontaine2]AHC55133.1 hypothetical protein TNS_ORF415 [Tunisvirus fontaine2]
METRLFARLTQRDFVSVGTGEETDVALEFLRLVQENEPDIGKKGEHRFWSGMEAKKQSVKGTVSDADYPYISYLFGLCKENGQYSKQMVLVSFMISSCFAYFSRGVAHVFLSSDKPTEEAGLTTGTNFMEAELPVLQRLKRRGKISGIFVSRFTSGWTEPQELNESFDIPVWRRNWHPMDGEQTKKSFVWQNMTQDDWEEWRKTEPRKSCSLGSLRKVTYALNKCTSSSRP